MIDRLVERLLAEGVEPEPAELADTLWLALQMRRATGARATRQATLAEQPVREEPPGAEPPGAEPPGAEAPADEPSTPEPTRVEPPAPRAPLHAETRRRARMGAASGGGLPFHSPGAPALPGALELARAMRPLMRRVAAPLRPVLDEAATAQRVAETRGRIWSPVLQPGRERWLAVDLVVDEGDSMVIWRRTVAELRRLLERQGAFRDLRVWGLDTGAPGQVALYAHGDSARRPRSPHELVDPAGRRLTMLVSDCVGPAWWSGAVLAPLRLWAASGPTTIVQLLPERLWPGSALGAGVSVGLHAGAPGLPSARLTRALPTLWEDELSPAALALPVLTLESGAVAAWAQLVAGDPRAWAVGAALAPPDDPTATGAADEGQPTPEERLERFRAVASPQARQLAAYLAAAPLTLPVMRLVQAIMLPESRQTHLAEVFLGGLLRRVEAPAPGDDPDLVRYDFVEPRLRDMLLDTLATPDAVRALRAVADEARREQAAARVRRALSEAVERTAGHALDFDAILADPEGAALLPADADAAPFADVAARVLRRLGGRYVRAAERLERQYGLAPAEPRPRATMMFRVEGPREQGQAQVAAGRPIEEALAQAETAVDGPDQDSLARRIYRDLLALAAPERDSTILPRVLAALHQIDTADGLDMGNLLNEFWRQDLVRPPDEAFVRVYVRAALRLEALRIQFAVPCYDAARRCAPQTLGSYEIYRVLDEGAVTIDYQARHKVDDRLDLLRVVHRQLTTAPAAAVEAALDLQRVLELRHPDIVRVAVVNVIDGRLVLAEDPRWRQSMKERLQAEGRRPWPEVVACARTAAEALHYAHGQGVVHRGLAPSAIRLNDRGERALNSFRLALAAARAAGRAAGREDELVIGGSPAYTAPEVWERDADEPPVDVYALACIVYELTTGRRLFDAPTPTRMLRAHLDGPQLPERWPEDVPPGLGEVLLRALSRDPAERPTPLAFAAALEAMGPVAVDEAEAVDSPLRLIGKDYLLGRVRYDDGYGVTYDAIDQRLERQVSVRRIHPQLLVDLTTARALERELRAVAGLAHQNIAAVVDLITADGALVVVQEAFAATMAERLTTAGPLPWSELLDLLGPICDALDYAHGAGHLHRDLRPANLWLAPDGRPLLSGFGIGPVLSQRAVSLSIEALLGFPAYVAPELWDNADHTRASDIYALACITYELLTGGRLFDGSTVIQVMRAHDRGPALSATWPAGTFPDGVATVLRRALARDPAERYASATAFYEALAALRVSEASRPTVAPQPYPTDPAQPAEAPVALRVGVRVAGRVLEPTTSGFKVRLPGHSPARVRAFIGNPSDSYVPGSTAIVEIVSMKADNLANVVALRPRGVTNRLFERFGQLLGSFSVRSGLEAEFRIETELSRRGISTVYKGHVPSLRGADRRLNFAIKAYGGRSARQEQVEALRAEAQALAAVRHETLPALYRYGELPGLAYLACSWIEGPLLNEHERLRDTITWARFHEIVSRLAVGLAALHQAGFAHGDVRPENVLLSANGPVLIDFGQAHRLDGHWPAELPLAGLVPLQQRSEERLTGGLPGLSQDRSSPEWIDIAGLGWLAYELYTGFAQTRPSNPVGLEHSIRQGSSIGQRLSRTWPPVEEIVQLISRAVDAGHPQRFSSIEELAVALDELDRQLKAAPQGFTQHAPVAPAPAVVPGTDAQAEVPAGLEGNTGVQLLGKYQLLEEIGAGGFARVYRALDTRLDREVALKVLHPQLLMDKGLVDRFYVEARALAQLRHPAIVTIYDVSMAEGRLYIAMQLASGGSLARYLGSDGPLVWPAALRMLEPICNALDYAHGQGIIHRDLKPANVLFDHLGAPLLSDFGFARLVGEESSRLTAAGGLVGTPGYVAPEIWEGAASTPGADIYALACMTYEMLTGAPLFSGTTPLQALRAHIDGPHFPTGWASAAALPPGVEGVLRRALARRPEERFTSATAFYAALADLGAAQGRPA